METYITICKIDSQWEFAVWLRELKLGLCDSLEECDGEGGGMEVQEGGDICIPMADYVEVWQKTTKFCKAIILQKDKLIKKYKMFKKMHLIASLCRVALVPKTYFCCFIL